MKTANMSKTVDDRIEKRGSWTTWSEFLFAFLGSLIGYGNVWRFPYVCFRNGGDLMVAIVSIMSFLSSLFTAVTRSQLLNDGAFLVPFFISIFICGVPVLFLETLYSQYSNYGPGRVWEICPLFRGIGLCMLIMVSIVSMYYTMIMAWTVYYLVNSFYNPIPWSTCNNDWNTENCTVSINESVALNGSVPDHNTTRVSSVEEFWFNNALDVTSGIDDLGIVRPGLVLCLLASWIVTCLCLVKGIKSLGKVAYVAASLPYVILTCLLIRGCLLPGSNKGIYYFIVPRWELLGQFTVWRDAATQMFYSIGISFGTVATLSSYNRFHNNCYRDAIILPLLDSFTSLYAGLVIFTYLGYTAHVTNKDVDQVVADGPGLVFMAYPAALATLPLPQLWSVLFFLMLFAMGLDSQCVHVEVVITAIMDCLPQLRRKKLLVTVIVCIGSFFLGLPLTTQAGVYILNLLDWYIASVALLLTAAIETFVLAWIYGTDRLFSDIEQMIGYRPPIVFKFAWKFISPVFVLFLWITGFIYFDAISTKQSGFNLASDIGGVIIAICPILAIPVVAVWELSKRHGSLVERVKQSSKPTRRWRPALYDGVSVDGHNADGEIETRPLDHIGCIGKTDAMLVEPE